MKRCKECNGSGICPHGKLRDNCADCDGVNICKNCHERRRNPDYPYDIPDPKNPGQTITTTSCATCFWNDLGIRTKNMTSEQIADTLKDPRYKKRKEIRIKEYIKNVFDAIVTWRYQTYVPSTCEGGVKTGWYYIDLECDIACDYKDVIEIDEGQHRLTSCDLRRMLDIIRAYLGQHIVFIRFNPDSYKDASGKTQPGMFTQSREPKTGVYDKRMKLFVEFIKKTIERDPKSLSLGTAIFVNYDANSPIVEEARQIMMVEQVYL